VTAVSLSIQRGVDGFLINDITVGALAPDTNVDMEFRFQVLDLQGKNMNDLDLVKGLKAIIRWLETNGKLIGTGGGVAITTQPSGPPN
jgi:hypothetical protein